MIFRGRMAGRVAALLANSKEQPMVIEAVPSDVDFAAPDADANVVTSRMPPPTSGFDEQMHMPVIDLDFPARLEPSSTEGHFHLYLDWAITQAQLFKLLAVMTEIGLVEEGYTIASMKRGYTTVRLPHIKKEAPAVEQPAQPQSQPF
jgi:hypothetical protein